MFIDMATVVIVAGADVRVIERTTMETTGGVT
jgi:hypothetical protein